MGTQQAIERILKNFTRELARVFEEDVKRAVKLSAGEARKAGRTAAPRGSAKPAKATRKPAKGARRLEKSRPEEVDALGDQILGVLRKSDRNLAAAEIFQRLGLEGDAEGRFSYAFNKLKREKRVLQHGERRMAKYGLAADRAARRKGPGRPKKAAVEEAPAAAEAPPAEG